MIAGDCCVCAVQLFRLTCNTFGDILQSGNRSRCHRHIAVQWTWVFDNRVFPIDDLAICVARRRLLVLALRRLLHQERPRHSVAVRSANVALRPTNGVLSPRRVTQAVVVRIGVGGNTCRFIDRQGKLRTAGAGRPAHLPSRARGEGNYSRPGPPFGPRLLRRLSAVTKRCTSFRSLSVRQHELSAVQPVVEMRAIYILGVKVSSL